jgi:hypothetical protein
LCGTACNYCTDRHLTNYHKLASATNKALAAVLAKKKGLKPGQGCLFLCEFRLQLVAWHFFDVIFLQVEVVVEAALVLLVLLVVRAAA